MVNIDYNHMGRTFYWKRKSTDRNRITENGQSVGPSIYDLICTESDQINGRVGWLMIQKDLSRRFVCRWVMKACQVGQGTLQLRGPFVRTTAAAQRWFWLRDKLAVYPPSTIRWTPSLTGVILLIFLDSLGVGVCYYFEYWVKSCLSWLGGCLVAWSRVINEEWSSTVNNRRCFKN